jgi:hypothetical protein
MRRIILLGMVGCVIAAILFAAAPVMGKPQPGRVAWIEGTGGCGSGCYNLDVKANLFKDGSSTGSVQCGTEPSEMSGCAAGPVIAVVPPASGSHTWCITARRSDIDPESPRTSTGIFAMSAMVEHPSMKSPLSRDMQKKPRNLQKL